MSEKPMIIPFGKYKDQPLEVLRNDPKYTEWVLAQDWFGQRFPDLKTIIINNFQQPQDTPEHNKLVAKFLNEDFCMKVVDSLNPGFFLEWGALTFENIRDETVSCVRIQRVSGSVKARECLAIKSGDIKYESSGRKLSWEKKFELHDGNDLRLFCQLTEDCMIPIQQFQVKEKIFINPGKHAYKLIVVADQFKVFRIATVAYKIEIKPIVSDDFPTVMRQCKSQRTDVLLIGQYTGIGASIEEVRAMFPEIKIVLLSDLYK